MASPSLNPAAGQTANNSAATITSPTLTTTVTNCVIIAIIYSERTAVSVNTVASVTGGLSFTRLGGEMSQVSATAFVDVWWLGSASTFSDTIKATLNATPGNAVMHVFGVNGCASIVTPFDPNGGLPAVNTNTTGTAVVTYSTTNSDDLIIAAIINGSISLGTMTAPGIPTGFTSILSGVNAAGAGSMGDRSALLSVSAPQSGASMSSTIVTFDTWSAIVFALTADASVAKETMMPMISM